MNIFFMKKDKPDKPATTPAVKKKPKPNPESLSSEENEVFLNHINEYLLKKECLKKDINYNYEHLYNHISEYLESFIAFGYTYSGERILIQHAVNARDKDALQEFIKNVFITTTKDNLIIDRDTDE